MNSQNPLHQLAEILREIVQLPFAKSSTQTSNNQHLDYLHNRYRAVERRAMEVYNLLDIHQISDPKVQENANRVGALLIKKNEPIEISSVGCEKGLCPGQPHHQEPFLKGFVGTGFLLDDTRIITTKHISQTCGTHTRESCWEYLVFVPNHLARTNTGTLNYQTIHLTERDSKGIPEGWDIGMPLDLPISLSLLPIHLSPLEPGEEVYMIGHPIGMPKKYAEGIVVNHNQDEAKLTLLIPAMDGSSGSPIFRKSDHALIGMFYRGIEQLTTLKGKPCHNSSIPTCHKFQAKIKPKTSHHISTLKLKLHNGHN